MHSLYGHSLYGFVVVFAGAGIGGMLRHGINMLTLRLLGPNFPYGTLAANITGSLAMGLVIGLFAAKGDPGQTWRLFVTTGILGGYTTFSAFSLDAVVLYERGAVGLSALYVLASVVVSIGALLAGLMLMRSLP